MSALATTLRIARRDALRSKGRSALVIAMIGLPVLGVGAADVLYRTFQLSPDQKATRVLGAADGVLTDTGMQRIQQGGGSAADGAGGVGYAGGVPRAGAGPAPDDVVPAGTRLLADAHGPGATLSAGDRSISVELRAFDYTDPLARGIVVRGRGAPPANASEVALDVAAAHRLGLTVGDHLVLRSHGETARTVRVSAVVTEAGYPDALRAIVAPAVASGDAWQRTYLLDVPGRLTWADVQAANAKGFGILPRTALPGEPPTPYPVGHTVTSSTLTAVSLIVGMTLLEIVLLAGPAFAVGAKRQSRDLALLSATGADRRDIRATVLGGGVVLGGLGGVLGAIAGIAVARLAVPRLESYRSAMPGPFEVRPLEMAGVAAVGLVTAVLAALLPARAAARQDVVAALTGRRGQVRSLKRVPVLGVIAASVGLLVALQGARERSTNIILAGSALAELGIVATTPFLVGLLGRIGPFLPVGPRLALRDATRNRGRTAPAVSAVLAAVAGSVAVSCYLVSLDHYHARSYVPTAPHGATTVSLQNVSATDATRAVDALRTTLPADTRVTTVRGMELRGGDDGRPPYPTADFCDARCTPAPVSHGGRTYSPQALFPEVLVGGVDELSAIIGRDASAYARMLSEGGAVGPMGQVFANGRMRVSAPPRLAGGPPRQISIRADVLPPDVSQVVFLSPAAAERLHVPVSAVGVIATASSPPPRGVEDRARNALSKISPDLASSLRVERGYQSSYALGLLALVIGSAVIVLGASGIATGLAAADGRADLATLAAVGASPGRRRSLAAFQSAVTAVTGTALGTVAGLVPAFAMVRALNQQLQHDGFAGTQEYPFVMPWTNVLVTLLAVPLLAASAAALFTRSRLPMVRRVA